jgi:hypothetical protein
MTRAAAKNDFLAVGDQSDAEYNVNKLCDATIGMRAATNQNGA